MKTQNWIHGWLKSIWKKRNRNVVSKDIETNVYGDDAWADPDVEYPSKKDVDDYGNADEKEVTVFDT